MTPQEKSALIQLVGLTVGKAVAQFSAGSGADGNAAGVTAKLATQFNYLNHTQAAQFRQKLDSCESRSGGCPEDERKALIAQYRALSAANIETLNFCAMRADAACLAQIKESIASPSEMPLGLVGGEATAFRGEQTRADSQVSNALNNVATIQKGRDLVCGAMSAADCDAKILKTHGDAGMRAMGIVLSTIGGGVSSSAEAIGIVSSGLQALVNAGKVAGTELVSFFRLGPIVYCSINPGTCVATVDVAAQSTLGTAAPSPVLNLPVATSSEIATAKAEAAAADTAADIASALKNQSAKNLSGTTSGSANSARDQYYGNGSSASPSPGTSTAGSSGGNVQLSSGGNGAVLVPASGTTPAIIKGGTVELFTDATGAKVPGAVAVGPTTPGAVAADATNMPNIPSNSQAQVVANNPYISKDKGGTFTMMDYLPEAARITQPGGEIIINGNAANKYVIVMPTPAQLDALGLKVQYQGPLLPQFRDIQFSRIDGSPLTKPMQSVVFVKK